MLYKKNDTIQEQSRIILTVGNMQVINPTREMLIADGWEEYTPEPSEPTETEDEQLKSLLLEYYNSKTDITDEDALKRPLLVKQWSEYVGSSLAKGQIVNYNGQLYRVRQDIATVLDNHYPSMDTAALYEVIEIQATGSQDDPINYVPPMEIFNGKYYMQNDVLYKCTRDSGQALTHDLSALVGLYVEVV